MCVLFGIHLRPMKVREHARDDYLTFTLEPQYTGLPQNVATSIFKALQAPYYSRLLGYYAAVGDNLK